MDVRIDLQWFRKHLLDEILPLWLKHAVCDSGFFMPNFDREWRPRKTKQATLVSQSRLLYNFAMGYRLTNESTYLAAVERGAHYLLQHFCDSEHGGWFYAVDADGRVIDEKKDSYGHAFLLFGLAHAYAVTKNEKFLHAAAQTWELMQQRLRDEFGGYFLSVARNFQQPALTRSQNPLMHLFEALLALGEASGMKTYFQDARVVADFVLSRLRRKQDGLLPEFYDASWNVAAGEKLLIDIGHAFEWAFLLARAHENGFPQHYLTAAHAFLEQGMRLGYDPIHGGIFASAHGMSLTVNNTKGWWQQCEAVRALMHFAIRRGIEKWLHPLQQTLDFIQENFIDPEFGGWYIGETPGTKTHPQDKGSVGKVDYHVVGMCTEAIRLQEMRDA